MVDSFNVVRAYLHSVVTSLIKSERGASAVEYGLLIGLIAVVIITAVALLGTNLTSLFNRVAGSVH